MSSWGFGETIFLDWGLAAEADTATAGAVGIADERPADLTRQGAIMGTPATYHIATWQAGEIEDGRPWRVAVIEVWK